MTSLDVRGARIAYVDEGSGPLVINAHGLTQGIAADRALGLTDWLALRDSGFRMVSYDARGHGQTSGTDNPEDYLWPNLAEDLLAVIDHFSPDEPVKAVGISMGTATILHALTMAPERFSAVVLGAPPTGWETRAAQTEVYEQLAGATQMMTPDQFAAALAAALVAPIFAEMGGYPKEFTPKYELLPAVFRGAGRSNLPDISALAQVDVPAFIMAWETDATHPMATAVRLHETLPDSQLHVSTAVDDIKSWGGRAAEFFQGIRAE